MRGRSRAAAALGGLALLVAGCSGEMSETGDSAVAHDEESASAGDGTIGAPAPPPPAGEQPLPPEGPVSADPG